MLGKLPKSIGKKTWQMDRFGHKNIKGFIMDNSPNFPAAKHSSYTAI